MPKVIGVSKGVAITYGSRHAGRQLTKHKTTANWSLKQIEKEKEAHLYEISGQYFRGCPIFQYPVMPPILTVLSFTQRQHILYEDLLQNKDGDVVMDVGDDSDWEDEVQDGLCQLPPGEEGFLQSHAGGEAVLQAVMDGITLS